MVRRCTGALVRKNPPHDFVTVQTQSLGTKRHDANANTRWTSAKRARNEFSPKADDVLFYGNPRLTNAHPGNQKFALLIKKCITEIKDNHPLDDIAEAILKCHEPHEGPSIFFERNKESESWVQLNTCEAVAIIKHTLEVETEFVLHMKVEQGKLNLLATALDSADGTRHSAVIDEAVKSTFNMVCHLPVAFVPTSPMATG